jgi:hypothetical protein
VHNFLSINININAFPVLTDSTQDLHVAVTPALPLPPLRFLSASIYQSTNTCHTQILHSVSFLLCSLHCVSLLLHCVSIKNFGLLAFTKAQTRATHTDVCHTQMCATHKCVPHTQDFCLLAFTKAQTRATHRSLSFFFFRQSVFLLA